MRGIAVAEVVRLRRFSLNSHEFSYERAAEFCKAI
jgi:hypothetical protein